MAIAVSPAQAEYANTPVQAIRANAEWLAWAPVPEAGRVAVCLVDTGVDANSDTSSAVVAASPLDLDAAAGDGGATKHGTLMASVMAAPHNGWGMVGAWPQLRIIDVRAVTPGANTFTYLNYQRAIGRCQSTSPFQSPVRVINLSLGSDPALVTAEERASLAEAVEDATQLAGINVVAAAGNVGGAVQTPGDYPGIFTVAAGDAGALCSFASRGPQVDLAAPGCGLDQAFPDGSPAVGGWGSSQAAAFTSAVIAALRAYKPSLSMAAAEAALLDTATPIAGGYVHLDVKAAFEAEGLSAIVTEAQAARAAALTTAGGGAAPSGGGGGGGGGPAKEDVAEVSPAPEPTPQAPAPAPAPTAVPPAPASAVADPVLRTPRAAKLSLARHGVRLRLKNRPADALAIVEVYDAHGELVARMRGERSRWTIRVRRWARVEVFYRDGLSVDSEVLVVEAPAAAGSGPKAKRVRPVIGGGAADGSPPLVAPPVHPPTRPHKVC